jgi:hypothetical protein
VEKDGKMEEQAYSYPYRDKGEIKTRSFPKQWFQGKPEQMVGHGRVEVIPADPSAETVYLHVLFPANAGTTTMPECSVTRSGQDYQVKVGNLSYTFQADR